MKKLRLLFILSIFLLIINFEFVSALDNSDKIYDYANVLSFKEEVKLKKEIDKYIDKNNIDLLVVTVSKHSFTTTMEYIDKFYNLNSFGIGENKSGLVIVLDLNLKKDMIEIYAFGDGKDFYSSDDINSIINKTKKYKVDYYKLFDKAIEESYNYKKDINNFFEISDVLSMIFLIFIFSLFISIVIIYILIRKSKLQINKIYLIDYVDRDSLDITLRDEKFITTHTTSSRL